MVEKKTNKLIEQTKTKPQQFLHFKQNKLLEFFSFTSCLNLEGERMLGVNSLKNSVLFFNQRQDNKEFPLYNPSSAKVLTLLRKYLDYSSSRKKTGSFLDILHFKSRGNGMKYTNWDEYYFFTL